MSENTQSNGFIVDLLKSVSEQGHVNNTIIEIMTFIKKEHFPVSQFLIVSTFIVLSSKSIVHLLHQYHGKLDQLV